MLRLGARAACLRLRDGGRDARAPSRARSPESEQYTLNERIEYAYPNGSLESRHEPGSCSVFHGHSVFLLPSNHDQR